MRCQKCGCTLFSCQCPPEINVDRVRVINAELLAACKAARAKFEEYYPARSGVMPQAVKMLDAAIASAEKGGDQNG